MHADRTNRVMLIVLALALLGAGGVAGATAGGLFGTGIEHDRLSANPVWRYIGANGGWVWPAAAGAALVMVILSAWWLATLLVSTDRTGDLPVRTAGPGRTRLASQALTDAVAAEIGGYRGVASAQARLIGDPGEPELVVTAGLEDTADFAALRQRIEDEALAHARRALGGGPMLIQLDLTVSHRTSSRVS